MPQNLLACDREQELLVPASVRDWLPEGHLAWFVIDAVAEMDLALFFASRGRSAGTTPPRSSRYAMVS